MKLPKEIINYIYFFDDNQYNKHLHEECIKELRYVLKYDYYEKEIKNENYIFVNSNNKLSSIYSKYNVDIEISQFSNHQFLQYFLPYRPNLILKKKIIRIYERKKIKKNYLLNLLYLF